MTENNTIDRNTHYTRGRDLPPISGVIYDVSYSQKYKNELSRLAAKEYILQRFKILYGSLGLKEEDELDKLMEISITTKARIIDLTRQGLTLDKIALLTDMPNLPQIKEMVASDPIFGNEYISACKDSSIFLADEIESLTKDYIDGKSALHIDAVGLNSIVKSLATVAKMKNPERFGESAKTVHNTQINNINPNSHSPQEIKMVIEHMISQIEDKHTLKKIIETAQNTLDDIINNEFDKTHG
jgi:hypothetical protein